ncbi:Uncharacterized protein dnm_044380 [Desulfonema magnum]|uniref:Uncharacterized protein n=1 Tax=Desulfonema magnum TaxID=45655 RepID=A0A975GPY7_9BACT|nr:Uncharacterized protein dnm_044380 [Desulfonema magnum]
MHIRPWFQLSFKGSIHESGKDSDDEERNVRNVNFTLLP